MTNIKEIALRVAEKVYDCKFDPEHPSGARLIEFATALIAEVQRQNEPVAWDDGTLTLREDVAELLSWKGAIVSKGRAYPNSWKPFLFTFPPSIEAERYKVAEACALKLESEANILASTCGYEDMGCLSFGCGEHAEAKMGRYNELLELAEAFRSGEWRRFEK